MEFELTRLPEIELILGLSFFVCRTSLRFIQVYFLARLTWAMMHRGHQYFVLSLVANYISCKSGILESAAVVNVKE